MTEQASPPASPEEASSKPDVAAPPESADTASSEKSAEAEHGVENGAEKSAEAEKGASDEAHPAPTAEPAWRPSYVFLAVVSIANLVADLATKQWAKARLEDAKTWADKHINVVNDVLGVSWSFTFARNRGGAWGLLQDEPESIRRPFFLGISVLAVVFIVSLYRKLTPQQWALKWGLPLVLGGALGNLVNRIQFNYVVDFIDFSYKGHHWPTFNVADISIVVGVGLMAVDMFTPRRTASTQAPAAAATDSAREPKLAGTAPEGGEAAPKET